MTIVQPFLFRTEEISNMRYLNDVIKLKQLSGFHQFKCRFSWVACVAEVIGLTDVNYSGASFYNFSSVRASVIYCQRHSISSLQALSPKIQIGVPWESSSSTTLLKKLELSLKSDHMDEAWEAFSNFKRLHGFPEPQLLSKIICLTSYSSNPHYLHKAYDLVLVLLKDKPHLLHYDPLTRLALSLARNQMAIPASTILRIMLERGKYPPVDVWTTLFFHLVKTETGSYLASDLLIEICECFLHHSSDAKKSKRKKLLTPDITLFNLVLDSCARYESTIKAQQIIGLISQAGIVADGNSIVIIARIYEMTGQRDELRKLKSHIDGLSSVALNRHYQQFYDCLLSLHFKYNDLDAAAELVLELYQRLKSVHSQNGFFSRSNRLQRHCLVQIGSSNLRMGYKIMIEPEQLKNDFVIEAQNHSGLVIFMDGKLVPSGKALSKLINGYVREGKVVNLSTLLISIQKEMDPEKSTLSADVVDACIQLGWLDTAHDILDDLESAGLLIQSHTYTTLLKAYCKESRSEESIVLVKQMRKVGLIENLSDEKAISFFLLEDNAGAHDAQNAMSVGKLHLAELLDRESREENSTTHLPYEFNSTILFFCKAKMIEDALKTFKLMEKMNVQPMVQSFSHLVNCYSSLKMYRGITILWGEIRKRLEGGVLTANRDLFECLLWNFLRGGYFERVMEIINYMTKHNMFVDKWKYRREFLKFHKDLYRNLKALDAKTDAQSKRLEHVRAFRRWAGIEQKS